MVSGEEVSRGCGGADGHSVGVGEPERAVVEALHVESALVHEPMVGRAEQHEVVERGLATVGPVPGRGGRAGAGWRDSRGSGSRGRGSRSARRTDVRNAAGAPSYAQRLAVGSIDDGDDAGVAAQPPGGLRRDGRAVLDFAAPRASVCKHIGLDMDDDFVPVRRKRRRIVRFEHPLGHPRQRIGAAHRARGSREERPTWDVGRNDRGVAPLMDR